ncbi:MAG TPA: sn-glycerol-1-phosphate dehydrogenase [Bacillota bacterium]|nr:sn-glycerol-1-phosphate dehydrogenase [Bacillota bacterium]
MQTAKEAVNQPRFIATEKIDDITGFLEFEHKGSILLVADNHTYEAAGKKVRRILELIGFSVHECILVRPGVLVPDETAIREIMTACQGSFQLLFAVGSGCINDLMKYVSQEKGIPLITLATAASMDGYNSSVAALTIGGYKKTVQASPPMLILSVTEILNQSPKLMTAAGIGDLLGKYTSLTDWKISTFINDEPYSEKLVQKLREALVLATSYTNGNRQDESIQHIMKALIVSGEVMWEWGNSRPASGAEHHLSHFWELQADRLKIPGHLHGQKVGVATVLINELYYRIFSLDKDSINRMIINRVPETKQQFERRIERVYGELSNSVFEGLGGLYLDESRRRERQQRIVEYWDEMKAWVMENLPHPQTTAEILKKCGAPTNPAELEIDKSMVVNAIQNAKEMRSRYTILRLAEDIGYPLGE